MQGLPHVASIDSLLIPRSGDSTGGDARPACLRPGSTAALRRGDLFLQPLSQPSLHVPPPLCRAHGHPPGQGDSPHMPSQKSFKTCSVAKAIVPRCPSSPPWKEKGSVSAGLVFLPYCDSGQFVTPPPRQQPVLYEHLRASWEGLVLLGPIGPKTTPLVSCRWSGKPSRYPPGSSQASSPNVAPRPQTPVSGRGNGVAGSPGGETGPKDSHSMRHGNVDAAGTPGHVAHNPGAAGLGSSARALILGPTLPHLGVTGSSSRLACACFCRHHALGF